MGSDMTPLMKVYESVKDRLPFGFDTFSANLKDWDVLPVIQQGVLFGGVLVKNNEIHVGFAEKPKASIRKNIKEVMIPLLQKHGFLITYVSKNNLNGLKFCKRLGFVEVAEDNDKIMLKCNRSNYV